MNQTVFRRTLAVALAAFCAITLTLTAAVPTGRPEEVGFSSDRLQRINDVIQRYIAAKDIAGAVTVVTRRGRMAHFEAHGLMDLESKRRCARTAFSASPRCRSRSRAWRF